MFPACTNDFVPILSFILPSALAKQALLCNNDIGAIL